MSLHCCSSHQHHLSFFRNKDSTPSSLLCSVHTSSSILYYQILHYNTESSQPLPHPSKIRTIIMPSTAASIEIACPPQVVREKVNHLATNFLPTKRSTLHYPTVPRLRQHTKIPLLLLQFHHPSRPTRAKAEDSGSLCWHGQDGRHRHLQ